MSIKNEFHNNLKVCIVLILFILMSYQCYTFLEFQPYFKLMKGLSILILIFISIGGLLEFRNVRFRTELFIVINVCITMFISLPSEGLSTAVYYVPYLTFLFPFYLIAKRPSLSALEKILFYTAAIYLLCWIYQVLNAPHLIFVGDNVDMAGDESRGFLRFYIPTKEHLAFFVFFFLALYNKTGKFIWLFFAFGAFVLVVLHVMRQAIFWTLVMAVAYYLVANKRNLKRNAIFIAIIVLFSYYIIFDMMVVNELNLQTLESIGSNSNNGADFNNIRFEAINHFLKTYNQDLIHFLWGNGLPRQHSEFSNQLAASARNGYYISDIGFVGLYVNFGIISVILYVYLLYRILFRIKAHSDYSYLKYYIGYLVFTYLGGHALTSNLIFFVIATYILKSSQTLYIKR